MQSIGGHAVTCHNFQNSFKAIYVFACDMPCQIREQDVIISELSAAPRAEARTVFSLVSMLLGLAGKDEIIESFHLFVPLRCACRSPSRPGAWIGLGLNCHL